MQQTQTTLERAHAALKQEPRTPAQLIEILEVNRNSVQRAITRLRDAGIIEPVGIGYSGATIWGLVGAEAPDPATLTKQRLGIVKTARLTQPVDLPAEAGVWPTLFDKLIVTGVGVDAQTGHAIAKLQRADGVTWQVDLEAVA